MSPRDRRAEAKLVYRALRAAGPTGLDRLELETMLHLGARDVLETIIWLRMNRVDVQCIPPPEILSWAPRSRFVLAQRLPDSWDATV